jgi:cytosolic carboxypeptidase protein 2/3
MCPIVTITSKKYGADSFEYKKVAIITARQHPGETVSSFECEGFMEFILGGSQEAVFLRENYVFKFLPMLNPDGVYYGNFRCGLSGEDLNRRWYYPKKVDILFEIFNNYLSFFVE